MAKKTYTGNDLLDRLMEGPYVRNPQYNPKTKAGRTQPSYLLDTSAGDINSGMFTNTARAISNLSFTGRDLGLTNEDIEEYSDRGISISPYNSEKEINRALAQNQSAFEQFGNFLMQAGVGEVILGTLEGFGNIADGVINTFTRDNYGVNPYTQYMAEAKENLKNNFKIYREDPNATFAIGDFGWWMDNAVSVATTASLLLPAAGWARGLSYVGKISGLGKLGRASSKLVSRGIAKATTRGKVAANDFGAIRSVAAKAGKIDKTIRGTSEIVKTATLSRAGENYMEAKAIYDDVYTNSKENLDGMPAEEFAKFIVNNPEFEKMSKDEIAKEIARKSANKTFMNDYWMLVMDIPQFKALGSIWGKGAMRSSKASERIAAANQRKLLAGATNEQLIKDNIINRTKEGIRYALKNPVKSLTALEFGEGFEEMYQGIQTEKGMEVATKYFDPSFTSRSLSSYFDDSSIWEQGFWGWLGGIGFNIAGKGLQRGSHAAKGLWNKKHMTAEDYERWKRSSDKVALEQINNVTNTAKQFVSEMEQISNGINPYDFVRDASTGQYVIKDGNIVNETIDETQKDLLKEHAIRKFVDGVTQDAVDTGTIDLMKEIIGSSEFDKFIADNGLRLSSGDKTLSRQVVDRMNEVSGIYYNALNDVSSLTEDSNPYVTRAVARKITNNKLLLQDYNIELYNIDARIAEANDSGTDYSNYEKKTILGDVNRSLINLERQYQDIKQQYEDGAISKSAFDLHVDEINRSKKALLQLSSEVSPEGALDNIKNYFKGSNTSDVNSLVEEFNKFLKEYNELFNNKDAENNTPTETISNLIKQKSRTAIRRAFTESNTPISKEDYENMYNEFSFSMDEMMIKRTQDGVEKIETYLRNAENFDDAVKNLMNENTGDKKLDKVLEFIKYGYFSENATNGRIKGQIVANLGIGSIIDKIAKEREKTDKRNKEAAEQGVEIPTNDEVDGQTTEKDNNKQQEQTGQSSPSTGSETSINPVNPVSPVPPVNPINPNDDNGESLTSNPADVTNNPEPVETGVQTTPDEAPVTDKSVITEENPLNNGMSERELQEQSAIAEGYETNSLKSSLDASKYVMQIGFKESGRIDNITKALAEGDNSKYEEFIKEVTDFLINRGYSKNLAEVIAKKAFANTVASFGAMNNKSSFGRLAQQLAMGFGEEGAKKYSITELLDGKCIDEVVEFFLNEYSRLVNNNAIDDVHIINMESLFNYILANDDIDIQTAYHIYNNIGKFIATHDGSKYKFTGFNSSADYSAKEFIDRLNEKKAQTLASMDDMHISPIEPEQRTADYTNALIAAANGVLSYVKIEGTSKENGEPVNTHIAVYVDIKKGNRTVPVKIGILRTVKADSDLSNLSPVSHYSGFSNAVSVSSNGDISLDCDFLFNALINEHSTDAGVKQLFNDLAKYYITTRDILNRLNRREIKKEQAQEEMGNAMPLDVAERILNNSLIVRLLQSDKYKFSINEEFDTIKSARKLAKSISNILFYGHDFDNADPLNRAIDDMAVDAVTMRERYDEWKQKVYSNYVHTYELQKGLTSEDSKVNINVNVSYHTILNTIKDASQYINIEDSGFDVDRNSPTYTPLVMVNPNGHLVDEYGNDYGAADISIAPYSMGFLVHNKDGIKYVAYFNTAQELNGSPIHQAVQDELFYLINKQLYNTSSEDHDANFEDIFSRLRELFNPKGMFIFNGFKTVFRPDQSNTFGSIATKIGKDDKGNDKYKHLITFYLRNKDNVTNSNAIGLYIPRLGRQVFINGIKDTKTKNGEFISQQEIKDALNAAIKEALGTVKLNKSLNVLNNRGINGAQSNYYRRENGKFVVNLGGKDYVYENYGDFMLKNRAFNTNVDGSSGSFVTGHLNENSVSINTRVRDTTEDVAPKNTFVSDLLFNDKNPKRKTVDTKDVLKAAGVPQEKIDVLLGTNSGMQIVTKRITASPEDDGETNAYYNQEDNTVYVTQKGAAAMNNNPTNAIRLILHENLHRLFHNKRNYNDTQRERILKELREVYDYTLQQLEKDRSSGKIKDSLYNSIVNVLNKATVSNNEQVAMEEFLMECLTQPVIVDYLNNTDYHSEAIIDGIPQNKKSIFQKIMDILLDLLGIKTNRIRNNSILAREYIILSKGNKATSNITSNKSAESAKSDNAKHPVEGTSNQDNTKPDTEKEATIERLNKVRKEIDEVRKGFESRIKRSDNFEEDHTYYIDGKPADTSVTQQVKGKKDLGKWSVPSSYFGNTADEAARVFFENNGHFPDDYVVPNTTKDGENSREVLEKNLGKIKEYLDKRFGVGRYGVITEEFPIGGVVNVNGVDKTIAGTMDMLVYTENGDVYVFDFKTKRLGDGKAEWDEVTTNDYKSQVNIYRQLVAVNNPNIAGRIKAGGLIKFITDYPDPNKDGVEYRKHPNIPNQLQVREQGEKKFVNIQDSYVDYSVPYFFGDQDFEKYHIVDVEQKDYIYEIKPLPDLNEGSNIGDIAGADMIQDTDKDFDFDSYDLDDTSYMEDDYDVNDDDTVFKASTELIVSDDITTPTEIYAPAVANGSTDNAYGIQVVNNINRYIDSFPVQCRKDIKQLLANDELNYTCQ